MSRAPLRLLVDVNVWADYFIDRNRRAHDAAASFMRQAVVSSSALYTSSASLSELYFLLTQETKRIVRAYGASAVPAAAVRESSWASLRAVSELSMIVPVSQSEVQSAFSYRSLHDDFEDDLVIAAARRIDADYLVTFDRLLIHHAPVACLEPSDMTVLLKTLGKEDDAPEVSSNS